MAAAAGAAGGINLTTLWVNVAPSVAGLASKMQQHGHTAAVNFNDSFTKEWQRNLDTVSRTFTGALTEVSRASSTLISDMFSGQYPEPPDMSMFTNAMNDLVGKAGEIGIAMTAWMPVIGEVAGNFITTWTGAFQEVFGVAGQLTQVFYEMGNAWQEIGREILGVTGASRAELENYMGVVQDILASGDIVHMNDVVSAIGIIGDRMENITNPQLREFTTIVAQSQELLGKLDVAQAIAALNQWGIASDEAAGKFTGLVHVAQETKAPFDVLTRQMIQSGPILQQFGLNFDQVALFMGKMHKQGFELTRFAYQFQRAASDITREGKPLANALDEIRVTAENMLASGNEVGATQYLEGLFGPYGWPRLIGMLRTAKDEFANFTSDVSAGLNQNTEEINDQVNRTADLGEQFVVIRNRLMADFRVVSQGFADHLTQAGDNLQEWTAKHYGDMLGAARGFANGMITAVGGITDLAAGALGVISPMLNPIIDVTVAWAQVILSTIQTVTDVGSILPDWLVIGESDDWAKISSSIQTAQDGLGKIQGYDLTRVGENIAGSLSRFSGEMLPNFRDWVNESIDPLIEQAEVFAGFKDNVEALPDQKTFRLTGVGIREMEDNFRKIGITFDKTADGTVTKVKAINEKIANEFENWWEQNQDSELNVDLVVTPKDADGNAISSATDALAPTTPLTAQSSLPPLPSIPGITTGTASTPGALPATADKTAIANYILQKALSEGYSREQANQILIQAYGESGLDPKISGGVQGDDEVIGIFQQKKAFSGGLSREQRMDPQTNIDVYFRRMAEAGGPAAFTDPAAFLGKAVSVGGPWHPENQAKGHLTAAQQGAAPYIAGYQAGVAATLPSIPTTTLPPSGLPTVPTLPTTLPSIPTTTLPPSGLPTVPTAPAATPPDGVFASSDLQGTPLPAGAVEPKLGKYGWESSGTLVAKDSNGKWVYASQSGYAAPTQIPVQPTAPTTVPSAPSIPTGIVPPAGLPLAPLPRPGSPGVAAPGGTPTAAPATAPSKEWSTDPGSGYRYWVSPAGAKFLVPPGLPLPTIGDTAAPTPAAGHGWVMTNASDGSSAWVLQAGAATPPTGPPEKEEEDHPQVGAPETPPKPPSGPPELTPLMASGPQAGESPSKNPHTGTFSVAVTTVMLDQKMWMRYTFPDGTQYWATPAFLADHPRGVMSDDYRLPHPWVWAQTKQSGVFFSDNPEKRRGGQVVIPEIPDLRPYTYGDNPSAAKGYNPANPTVTGIDTYTSTTLSSPARGRPAVPPDQRVDTSTGGTGIPTTDSMPRSAPPRLPPQTLGPLSIPAATPPPAPAPVFPAKPPNHIPESELPLLPPGYHWEGGNSRWEWVKDGETLDPRLKRQGQYHSGGQVGLHKGGLPTDLGGLLAELEVDEFVVRKDVALNHMDKLLSLNETGKWPGFEDGGRVFAQLEEWRRKTPGLASSFDELPSVAPTEFAGRPRGTATPDTSSNASLGLGPTPNVLSGAAAQRKQNLTDFSAGVRGAASDTVLGTIDAVMHPVETAKALAPLIGAAGSGAPGVAESWLNLGKAVTRWNEWGDNPWGAAGGVSFDIASALAGAPAAGRGAAAASGLLDRSILPNAAMSPFEPRAWHPTTGFESLGFTRRGPVWPVAGAADDPIPGVVALPIKHAEGLLDGTIGNAQYGLHLSDINAIKHFKTPNLDWPNSPVPNSALVKGLDDMMSSPDDRWRGGPLTDRMNAIWQEGYVWNHFKDDIRAGAQRALRDGVPELSPEEYNDLVRQLNDLATNPTEAGFTGPPERWKPTLTAADRDLLHRMGAQMMARTVHTSAMSSPADRGMMVNAETLARLTSGDPISMPLSSFATRPPLNPHSIHDVVDGPVPSILSAAFAGVGGASRNPWINRQVMRLKAEGNREGVILSVLPGAQAYHQGMEEEVLSGTFGVANVIPPSRVPAGTYEMFRPSNVPTIIELYQKSLVENPRYAIGKQGGGPLSGVVPYYGEIGRDSVHAVLEPDEFVIKRPVAMKYLNELWHLNETGKWPGIDAQMAGFQEGGEVGSPEIMAVADIARQFRLQFTSGQRSNAMTSSGKSYHLSGEAGDFSNSTGNSPEQLAFAQYMHDNYGGILAELIYSHPGWTGNLLNGRPHQYGEGTLRDHQNHVHVAIDSEANGTGQTAPGAATLATPYAGSSSAGSLSVSGASTPSGTTALPGGGGLVTDPYTGKQVRLGAEDFQKWVWDQQGQQQKIGELQEDVARSNAEITDTMNKLAQAQADQAKVQQTYNEAIKTVQSGAPGWMPGMPLPIAWEQNRELNFEKKQADMDAANSKVANLVQEYERRVDAAGDKQTQLDRELTRPPDRPKGGKDEIPSDKNAQALGSGLVKGILQEFGFDGSVFSNPLDWGIWKLFTGGVNFLGGLNKMISDGGGGTGAGLFSGGPTGVGAAGDAGMSALTGLIPGVDSFLKPNTPGSPTAGVPHAMTPTAGPGPEPNYGINPGGAGVTFNFNGPQAVTDGFVQNEIVNNNRQSSSSAIQSNPSALPVPAG